MLTCIDVKFIFDTVCLGLSRLDFRRLPGPVFDPPRRETAGRVIR